MRTDELAFDLPDELIATAAADPRDSARLLVIDRAANALHDRRVSDLPEVLQAAGIGSGDVMVFNETKVLPAYFEGVRTQTQGRIKGLYLASPAANRWQLMIEARGKLQPGETIDLADDAQLTLVENDGRGMWLAEFASTRDTLAILDDIGQPPLPPYIRKQRKAHDEPEFKPGDLDRYNTIFARDPGSVAAPTAALHFTPQLFDALDALGVQRVMITLHVGMGTFAPVRADDLDAHTMHAEHVVISPEAIAALAKAKNAGKRILPVGTTSVRAIESLPDPLPDQGQPFVADTKLFIRPADATTGRAGFEFRFTDALMTNFHLPRSTLLALVAALPGVGLPRLKQWYQHAIDEKYRFYSYGDSMLIL